MVTSGTPKAIVIGHTSGLGAALTSALLAGGYEVLGVARRASAHPAPGLTELSADLSRQSDCVMVYETICRDHPAFGLLVYAAGVLSAHDIDAIDHGTLAYSYQVNTFAPICIESGLWDLIDRNGASVVNVTSSSIHDPYPRFVEYSGSKIALSKFSDDLRESLAESPARVMELCPSGFTSSMYDVMLGDKVDRDESKQIDVRDVARLIVTLVELPPRMSVDHIRIGRK